MLCLHGKPTGATITPSGAFWECGEHPSCHFTCHEKDAFLYDKAVKKFLATKQAHPKCCSVTPYSAERNYARIGVVMDIENANFGRPFFTCSKNRCGYFEWGDEIIIPKPLCQHGKPCKLGRVKEEGDNEGQNFLCCPEPRYKSCKFFRWLGTPLPREPVEDTRDEFLRLNEACPFFSPTEGLKKHKY